MIMNTNKLQLSSLNPYYYAVYTFLDRLRWDLNLKSWISRKKLLAIKNQCKGEKAIILCNGPSLIKTDLSKLGQIKTFGLNKINLLFDKSEFRPTYIISINKYVIEQNKNFFNTTNIPLFVNSSSSNIVKSRDNICYLHTSLQNKFAKDISVSLYSGGTVTFVAMQLAYHMGFSEIALIGCDHNFVTKGPSNKVIESQSEDVNHFDSRYFSDGKHWQLPDLPLSEYSYSMAKEAFELDGRKIYNATEGGLLEVFPRIKVDNFLS